MLKNNKRDLLVLVHEYYVSSGGAGGGEGVLFLRAPRVEQNFGAPSP